MLYRAAPQSTVNLPPADSPHPATPFSVEKQKMHETFDSPPRGIFFTKQKVRPPRSERQRRVVRRMVGEASPQNAVEEHRLAFLGSWGHRRDTRRLDSPGFRPLLLQHVADGVLLVMYFSAHAPDLSDRGFNSAWSQAGVGFAFPSRSVHNKKSNENSVF